MKRFASILASLSLAFAICAQPAAAAQSPARLILTSSSATSCSSVALNASSIVGVINAATAAQTVTLSLYDEGLTPTCATGDLVYSVVLSASQVVTFPAFVWRGLAYKLSAAATNNIVVYYNVAI
jgi:hypothetical protein